MAKQMIYGEEARKKLLDGITAATDAIKVTLGPKARTVVLDKSFGSPTIINHGVTKNYVLERDFFSSSDYRQFTDFGEVASSLMTENARVVRGDKSESILNVSEALEWLQKEALRGQSRQRYKGLGEMNPEELWNTTLNPETRNLLQVQYSKNIKKDHEIIHTLMGNDVSSRKDFIVSNAINVSNLDI